MNERIEWFEEKLTRSANKIKEGLNTTDSTKRETSIRALIKVQNLMASCPKPVVYSKLGSGGVSEATRRAAQGRPIDLDSST